MPKFFTNEAISAFSVISTYLEHLIYTRFSTGASGRKRFRKIEELTFNKNLLCGRYCALHALLNLILTKSFEVI